MSTLAAEIAAALLQKCVTLSELNQIHARIIRTRLLDSNPTPILWKHIIRSYTRHQSPSKALQIFISMLRAAISPDSHALSIAMKASTYLCSIQLGLQIHSTAIRGGHHLNPYCESAIISTYSKAGEYKAARQVLDENPNTDVASWNALVTGFSQNGHCGEAIGAFIEMKRVGFEPDKFTVVSVNSACGNLGDLTLAFQLHRCAFHTKPLERLDVLTWNSIIDMYGKCGRMELAGRVFSEMEENELTVSSWTSMITGYAMHGFVSDALHFFHQMQETSTIPPNIVTFTGVLSACVHGGLVREGKLYFAMMKNLYGLSPSIVHYACMVDLLGRAGLLDEARDMVRKMPVKANVAIWGCLMGACQKHENVEIGEWAARHLVELQPSDNGPFVVLSNIYASRGMWEKVEEIRKVQRNKELDHKIPGYSLTSRSH